MKPILVVKPGQISQEDKKTLAKEGVVVIEMENPNELRVINPIDSIAEGDDIFTCAIDALSRSSSAEGSFGTLLVKRIKEKRGK